MSCLTAPPLVSLLSLSRVQSQINSRLFLTLTYPSTCLHLQLAPRFSLFPSGRSSPLRGSRVRGGCPGGGGPGTAPLCPESGAVLGARASTGLSPRSRPCVVLGMRPSSGPAIGLETWGGSSPRQQQNILTPHKNMSKIKEKRPSKMALICQKKTRFLLALKVLWSLVLN